MNTPKIFTFIAMIVMFFLSCKEKQSLPTDNLSTSHTSQSDIGYFTIEGDSVVIPSFEILVKLSPKAEARLAKDKETVIVNATFSGIPKDTTAEDYLTWGETDIITKNIEMSGERLAKFENIRFSKSVLNALGDMDINLLINVFTGRRSSEDNLIDCDILQDKMSTVKGKRFTLKGKLIYGDE